MTLEGRLKILERRIPPPAPQRAPFDFDHDAYRALMEEAGRLPPEELARECAAILAAADWPARPTGDDIDWRGFAPAYVDAWKASRATAFDWPEFTRMLYGGLAGDPPDWREMVEEAMGR